MDKLTGKEPWKWEKEQQEAFEQLKSSFTQAPVLAIYDHQRESRIETDASGYATRAVFSQLQEDGKWHPMAFYSKSMDDTQRNYDIWDKEMLAIICTLEE